MTLYAWAVMKLASSEAKNAEDDESAAAFSAMAIAARALYEYGSLFIQIRPQHRV